MGNDNIIKNKNEKYDDFYDKNRETLMDLFIKGRNQELEFQTFCEGVFNKEKVIQE